VVVGDDQITGVFDRAVDLGTIMGTAGEVEPGTVVAGQVGAGEHEPVEERRVFLGGQHRAGADGDQRVRQMKDVDEVGAWQGGFDAEPAQFANGVEEAQ
jgi:hypothetical protein